jgi:hypothetical protein
VPRSEDIRNTIWLDLDEFSNDAFLLYIWSWTNERCGAAGFYSCPRRLLLEGRLVEEALDAALAELEEAGKLVYADGVLWSVTRVQRLGWKNPQAEKAINSELAELDSKNPIREAFIARYQGFPWGKENMGQLTLGDGSGMGHGTHTDGPDDPQPTHRKNGSVEPSADGSGMGQLTHAGKGNGEGKGNGRGKGRGQGSAARVNPLGEVPASVRDALPDVTEILGRISETRGLPFDDAPRIAAAMATYPDADHVAVASDFEDYLCNGSGKSRDVKDLIQMFRGQLDRKRPSSPAKTTPTEHPADRRIRELREAEPDVVEATATEVAA